jgi:hypothetical protein
LFQKNFYAVLFRGLLIHRPVLFDISRRTDAHARCRYPCMRTRTRTRTRTSTSSARLAQGQNTTSSTYPHNSRFRTAPASACTRKLRQLSRAHWHTFLSLQLIAATLVTTAGNHLTSHIWRGASADHSCLPAACHILALSSHCQPCRHVGSRLIYRLVLTAFGPKGRFLRAVPPEPVHKGPNPILVHY